MNKLITSVMSPVCPFKKEHRLQGENQTIQVKYEYDASLRMAGGSIALGVFKIDH